MTENKILKKRVEMLEKNFQQLVKQLNTNNRLSIIQSKSELYYFVARAVKNESEIDMIKEFLIERGNFNYLDYHDFRKDSELLRTYVDENKMFLELIDYYEKLKTNPDLRNNVGEYISGSNLVVIKNRIQIKRANAIKRGMLEKSEPIKELDNQIAEVDTSMKLLFQKKKEEVTGQDYFVKKEDAEKIFENISTQKEQIIERIRQVPLLDDLQMEPQNRLLYYEVISNYWFGNFNASIILLSVLVESFLKEIYFFKEGQHSEETLSPLIEICNQKGIITQSEKCPLSKFADTVRNTYLHGNIHRIVEKITLPAYKIDLTNPSAPPEPTYVTEDSLPTIRSIAKTEIDKMRSRKMIIEIIKMLSAISKRIYSETNDTNKSTVEDLKK